MSDSPEAPSSIGRYSVIGQIGRGGMGVLYLARDPAIDRIVAIKVARVQNDELRERFRREARATGRLNHRNIVTIFDVAEHDGEPYMAMEYVPGRTLDEIVRKNTPLPFLRRLRMLHDLCDGLSYSHGQGIVHRDVKPANLIVRDDTGALTIVDFGIARLDAAGGTTTGATAIGTPHYMSPEQIEGGPVDHRCDIFAVGLIFYELLSYRRAFAGDSPATVLYRIVHEQPPPLAELAPRLDAGLLAIVDRALAKRPGDRYSDLKDLIADLDAAVAHAEQDDRDPKATIVVRREDGTPAPSSSAPASGSGSGFSREKLIARREARILAHLDAARAALAERRCDAAEEAAGHAALLDPDDERVQPMFERIAAARRALQVERHLADARAHLADLALTKASESVDLALQVEPDSPVALQLRREVEHGRVIQCRLEEAEHCLGAGDFAAALRSVDEILATDPAHEAALKLRERVRSAEHDRALALVERARRQRATGDLAGARKTLHVGGEPHQSIAAELASVEAELRERRESFESLVEQARRRLEHGNLEDARDPMRRALDALSTGEERPAPDPRATGAASPGGADSPAVSHMPTSDTGLSPPPEQPPLFSVVASPVPEGRSRKPVPLTAFVAVATMVVAGAVAATLWLVPTDPDEQGLAPVAADGRGGPGGDTRREPRASNPAGPGGVPTSQPDAAPEIAAEEPGNRVPAPAPAEPTPRPSRPPSPPPQRARPAPRPSSPAPRAPAAPQPATPTAPSVAQLLADAVAAEAAGDARQAQVLYASVLNRDPDNRTARTGQQRVQGEMARTVVREQVQAGDAAFAAGRYGDARRHYQEALDRNGSPEAQAGLRRVANARALTCGDGAACGTLVVRVTPAAEILVDDRALGTATALELRLPAGRHRIRLETDDWRFPRTLDILPGATATVDVDLEQDGFPK